MEFLLGYKSEESFMTGDTPSSSFAAEDNLDESFVVEDTHDESFVVHNIEESFVEQEVTVELRPRKLRSIYLVTYSQANLEIFPTREMFANEVTCLFVTKKVKVVQWVCGMEQHDTHGVHYHLSVKLESNKRWLPVKQAIQEKFNAVLNFSSTHTSYFSTWRYVIKEDNNYVQNTCQSGDLTKNTKNKKSNNIS